MASAVSMQEITVRFDQVLANQNVNFEANWGEVHGLVGENGAGKTTLMRVLYGMYTHYEGDVYINGEKVRFASPKDAIVKGIGMVHQHFSLVPSMTVTENLIMGKPPYHHGLIDLKEGEKIVRQLSAEYGLDTIIQVFTDMQAFRMSETISFGLKPIRSRICRSRFLAFLRFQLLPLRSIFRYLAMRRTSCTDIVLLFNDLTAASILWWICPVTSMINAKPCSL